MIKKIFCLMVSIVCMIISLNIFFKEVIILDVTANNRETIRSFIKDSAIDNINDITKLELGQGWHSGKLSVHYSNGNVKDMYTGSEVYGLEEYIHENGYSLSEIGKIYFVFSIVNFIFFLILKLRTE